MKSICESCIIYKKYGIVKIKKEYFCKLDWNVNKEEKCDYIQDENEMDRLINNRIRLKNIIECLRNKLNFYENLFENRGIVNVDLSIKWQNYSNDYIISCLKDIK
jgi:hypothetical protein